MQTAWAARDWSDEQGDLLRRCAAQHGWLLELDITDDGETPFAEFVPPGNTHHGITLIGGCADNFLLTDREGYPLFQTATLPAALDWLCNELALAGRTAAHLA